MNALHISGNDLSMEAVREVAVERRAILLAADAREAVNRARAVVDALVANDQLAYAITTGVGKLSDVRIVGDTAKFSAFAPVVEDVFPGCGPLGGIHAALRVSKAELNLILAVDVPFVSFALLQFLMAHARNSGASVTVPRINQGWQPLCAIYRREFADAAETALRAGRYRIDALFDQVQVQVIAEEALEAAGFSSNIFRNLNTKEDLEAAR